MAWLSGFVACLILWARFRDPTLAANVPLWLGRLARYVGHGRFDERLLTWQVDAFWMRLTLTRLAIAITGAYGALLIGLHWGRVRARLVEFFTETRHPIDLAIFRIVVFAQIYLETPTPFIRLIASLPRELQFPPETGFPRLGPLRALAYWPIHPLGGDQVGFWCGVLKVACVTGMLGVFSRTSALLVSVLFFWVWGSIQWYGKVDHHHHLLWFALILGVARSGDALSVDALYAARRRARRGLTDPPPASNAYGMPLAFSMLLVGVIYFFPGFWKLATSGFDWALSDNLAHTMYMKWHMLEGWTPIVRVDRYPLLYMGGGLAVLLLEISFVFLVLGRRTRMIAAWYGIGFHAATELIMQISFWSLRNCYVVFFDWHRIFGWIGRRFADGVGHRAPASTAAGPPPAPAPDPRGRPVAVMIVGGLLVVGNVWAGALAKMDAWPLACYPLFNGIVGESYETMQINIVRTDGSERLVVAEDYRDVLGERWNHLLGRILDNPDEEGKHAQLRAVWRLIAARDPTLAEGELVRFASVQTWLEPERWHEPPGRRRVIYEFPVSAVSGGAQRLR
jgi:hypothetical protein